MIAKSLDIPAKAQSLRHVDDYLEVGQKAGASDASSQSGPRHRYSLPSKLLR
jgi:hypothetical protein